EASGADMRAGVGHEGTLLAGDGEDPARMDFPCLRRIDQRAAVRHREADVKVIPVLRLADAADRREVPAHLISQPGLCHQLIAAEQAADVIPLAAAVDDLSAGMKLQRTTDARGVAHLLYQLWR